jgi:hypothetical protein
MFAILRLLLWLRDGWIDILMGDLHGACSWRQRSFHASYEITISYQANVAGGLGVDEGTKKFPVTILRSPNFSAEKATQATRSPQTYFRFLLWIFPDLAN